MKVALAEVDKAREKAASRYVFILDIAPFLGRTTTAINTKAQKMGITPVLVRRAPSGKAALAITEDEARRIISDDIKSADTITPAELLKEDE